MKKTLEALRQRHEEESAHSEISQKAVAQGRSGTSQEKWETEQRVITAELLKLKDRLIDVEKNVCFWFCLFFFPPPFNCALISVVISILACFPECVPADREASIERAPEADRHSEHTAEHSDTGSAKTGCDTAGAKHCTSQGDC